MECFIKYSLVAFQMVNMSLLLYDLSAFSRDKQEKIWSAILQKCNNISEKMCFNVLYTYTDLLPIVNRLKFHNYSGYKIYKSSNSIICNVNQKTYEFAISLGFTNATNYFLEDISFFIGEFEFLATITHESYIICDASIIEPSFFQKLGILDFCEYI